MEGVSLPYTGPLVSSGTQPLLYAACQWLSFKSILRGQNEAVKTIMDEAHHPGIRTTTPFNNASQDTSTAVLLERQHDTRYTKLH